MSKQKDNKQKTGSSLKIITVLIVGVLILLSVGLCLICGIMANKSEKPIGMEDWLMAGCALLSMFGTIFLACVSVFQSDRANKLNERVIKQNEELQKLNDTQFKIANQKLFPLLGIEVNKRYHSICPKEYPLINWKNGVGRTVEDIPCIRISIDSRFNREKEAKYIDEAECILTNIGEVNISNIEIYKIAIANPFNAHENVAWPLLGTVLPAGKCIRILFEFFNDFDEFAKRGEALNFSIFIKMQTITGVIFYEKLSIFSSPRFSITNIDKILMEEITN